MIQIESKFITYITIIMGIKKITAAEIALERN